MADAIESRIGAEMWEDREERMGAWEGCVR